MLNARRRRNRSTTCGFTLVELLVVIGIIALLLAILIPTLGKANRAARRSVCLSNLRSIGTAIHSYALTNNGYIPYGPKAAIALPSNFYPRTGNVTSLISLQDGRPVGLGLMLADELSNMPKVLFCPDADQPSLADEQLALVGKGQAQSDYYYRHASGSSLAVDSSLKHIQLSKLGRNSQGLPIRALVMDVNFLAVPGLAMFGGHQRTCHNRETVNVLYSDGHVSTHDNRRNEFTVDGRTNIHQSFAKILAVFETADAR